MLAWGNFLTLTLNFVIIAWVLFIVVRLMNSMKKKEPAAAAAPAEPSDEVKLLSEIRDLLKKS